MAVVSAALSLAIVTLATQAAQAELRRAEACEAAHGAITRHIHRLNSDHPARIEISGTPYICTLSEYVLITPAPGSPPVRLPVEQATLDQRLSAKLHLIEAEAFAVSGAPLATLSRIYNPLNVNEPTNGLPVFINTLMEHQIEKIQRDSEAR